MKILVLGAGARRGLSRRRSDDDELPGLLTEVAVTHLEAYAARRRREAAAR